MFGGYDTQTIICIVLLLFMPIPINASLPNQVGMKQVRKLTRDVPYKEAASWKRINYKNSKVDAQRLYDAYRERFRGEICNSEDDLSKELDDLINIDVKSRDKSEQKKNVNPLMVKERTPRVYEATEKQQTSDIENKSRLSSSTHEVIRADGDQNDKEKEHVKGPVVSGMVILKMDVPTQAENAPLQTIQVIGSTSGSKTSPRPQIQQAQEALERRFSDLNRIYQEILNQQKPLPASGNRPLNVQKDLPKQSFGTGPSFITNSIHLSALTKLLDVLERVEQTDVVNEIAKKINDEMELTQPLLDNTNDVSLVTDSSLSSLSEISETDEDGINKLFDRIDPRRASSVFKRVASEMKAARPLIKSGGLYDEYKKHLYNILKEQKYRRQSITCDRHSVDSESSNKVINDPQYRCVETHAASKQREGIDNRGRNKNYLKALQTYININKENRLNGGITPYYLPNSKSRQLIWNEVPLVKPKLNNASKKFIGSDASSGDQIKFSSTSGVRKNNEKSAIVDMSKDLDPDVEAKQIGNAIKALKHSSFFRLIDEYQKQIEDLNKTLQDKQRWWKNALDTEKTIVGDKEGLRHSKRALVTLQGSPSSAINSVNSFPGVLLNPSANMNRQQIGGNIIDNMASQMNLSPLELAQRIASATSSQMGQIANDVHNVQGIGPPPPTNIASQIIRNQMPNATTNFKTRITDHATEVVPSQQQLQPASQNLNSILDKILERLETMQEFKVNQDREQTLEKSLPCCFADPTDGAPCDLNGSWESQILGIRINIRGSIKRNEEVPPNPTCAQPKRDSSSDASFHRHWRQCVKINSTQIKSMSEAPPPPTTLHWLNVTVQETTPPREHDIIDIITEWHFSGYALSILGGPITLSCRRGETNMIGTFVGYCRTCGCVDTIFGSWTFCQPSRDCQDITMSIFDRRDMLRRYSMDEKRPNRFKEQLYMQSKFAKVEKDRQQAKQNAFDKIQPLLQPQIPNQNQNQSSNANTCQPVSNPHTYSYIDM